MIEAKAPVKKAIYKETTILGKPKKSPKRIESFISPPPMLCFFVRRKNKYAMAIKNKKAPIAENK